MERMARTDPNLRVQPVISPQELLEVRKTVSEIYLALASKAHAFMQVRGYVVPQDVKTIGLDVLRHRLIPTYEAEAEGLKSEDLLKRIFEQVPVP